MIKDHYRTLERLVIRAEEPPVQLDTPQQHFRFVRDDRALCRETTNVSFSIFGKDTSPCIATEFPKCLQDLKRLVDRATTENLEMVVLHVPNDPLILPDQLKTP